MSEYYHLKAQIHTERHKVWMKNRENEGRMSGCRGKPQKSAKMEKYSIKFE